MYLIGIVKEYSEKNVFQFVPDSSNDVPCMGYINGMFSLQVFKEERVFF
jgi:hypothetical protein